LKFSYLPSILRKTLLFLLESMTNFSPSYDPIDDILSFDPDWSESKFNNRRVATRYIRNDIQAVFFKINFMTRFGFNFFRRLIPVQLLDISTRGVLISTHQKLKLGTKITLGLKFDSGQTFRIKAVILRKSTESDYEYGIKFNECNNELGDYLVSTQSELKFK
jgi:hypothetical protein